MDQPTAFAAYAKQLAAAVTPLEINRMKAAGLNRANRRRLCHLKARGKLTGNHFPTWLIARFISVRATV